jgi:hypothetical protein
LFHSRLLALLVVAGGLASSCQSSRPSFSFQPMSGRAVKSAEATAAAPVIAPEPAARPITVSQTKPVAYPPASSTVAQQQPKLVEILTEKNISLPTVRPAATHRRQLLARPHATAEAGLGTTVLGVLGLVVLPIALLGLLLSGGGLVWGIVAGAAALAVLVAWLDPFGG